MSEQENRTPESSLIERLEARIIENNKDATRRWAFAENDGLKRAIAIVRQHLVGQPDERIRAYLFNKQLPDGQEERLRVALGLAKSCLSCCASPTNSSGEDAEAKKYAGETLDEIVYILNAPGRPSEISVVAIMDALEPHMTVCLPTGGVATPTAKQLRSAARTVAELFATREPVSVSLEKCAEALHGTIIGAGKFEDWWHGESKEFGREFLGNMVMAVLNTAGVKYVD